MTTQHKQYVIAGVIGIGAIALFVHLAKAKPAPSQPAQPAPLSASQYPPPGVAQYPSASIAPAPIQINEAPLSFTYNYPSTRTPDTTAFGSKPKGDGSCCCGDKKDAADPTQVMASNILSAMKPRRTLQVRK